MPAIALLAILAGGLFGNDAPDVPEHLAPLLVEAPDLEPAPQPWARPLHSGPIETLVIAPRFALLDVAALARNLDLDLTVAPPWSAASVGYGPAHPDLALPGASGPDVLERLMQALDRGPDLIVLGRADSAALAPEALEAIVREARSGAGLILAGAGDHLAEPLRELLEDSELAEETDARLGAGFSRLFNPDGEAVDLLWAGEHAGGRIVELSYGLAAAHYASLTPALAEPAYQTETFLDGFLGALAQVCRWAAGRAPEARIVDIALPPPPETEDAPPPGELPEAFIERMREWRANPGSQDLRIAVEGAGGATYSIQVRVQGPDSRRAWVYDLGRAVWEHEGEGPAYFPVSLPMGAGPRFVDAWLLDRKGRVVDWRREQLDAPGWPRLEEVRFSKLAAAPHDAVTVTAVVPAFLAHMRGTATGLSRIERNCALRIEARDPHGRLVAEERRMVSAAGGAISVNLAWADLITNSLTIDVYAAVSGQTPLLEQDLRQAAHVRQILPIRHTPALKMEAVPLVTGALEPMTAEALRGMRSAGVRTASCPGGAAWARRLSREGLAPIPRLTSYKPEGMTSGNARQPCLSDPAYRLAEQQSLRDLAAPFLQAGAPVLSLGHDNRLGPTGAPLCQSDFCLGRFARWLEGSYGDLEALNRAWGARLTEWEQAQPFTIEQARETGVFAPWLDFRRSMDRVFTDMHADGAATLRALDPAARTGLSAEGVGGVYSGRDWGPLAQQLRFAAGPMDPAFMARIRSYRLPRSACGVFLDTSSFGAMDRAKWATWRAVFDGFSQVWWAAPVGGAEEPALGPMLDPWGRPTPSLKALSDAMAEANAGPAPLLLRAEPAQAKTAILDAQESRYLDALLETPQATQAAESAFVELLGSLGHTADFLTPARLVETGGLPYRCIVLPNTRALSNAAALALRAFSEAGGLLIAGNQPALYDEHGAPRETPALAEVFGVPPADGEQPKGNATRFTPGGEVRGPALFLSASASGGPAREAIAKALAAADIEPPFAAQKLAERPFDGVLRTWNFGQTRLMGALLDWDAADDRRLRIELGEDLHLYDALAGAYLGEEDELKLRLEPGAASLTAALPYRVTRLVVTAERVALKPGGRLTFAAEVKTYGGLPGPHLLRARLLRRSPMDFSGAGGDPIPYYTRFVEAEAGRATGFFPLALDEPPGAYAVEVTDVLTGAQALMNVEVIPRRPLAEPTAP